MIDDYRELIDELISLSIKEDIGDGDHTSLSTIPANARGKMQLLAKERCVIAGIEIAEIVFRRLEPSIIFETLVTDGDTVQYGDTVFYVEGTVITLLQAERIVLNIMQRMSGVATKTRFYVEQLKDFKTKILDTRKTTPGMRVFDKLAVAIGGGENHRMGLFDMIMIKDNHIDFAGGITAAVNSCLKYCKDKNKVGMKIEVETRSIEDIEEALATGIVDRIMLDNFSVEETREAVDFIRRNNKSVEIESSGGIRIDTIREYAACGVDYISIGALTHQVESIDLSLKACK